MSTWVATAAAVAPGTESRVVYLGRPLSGGRGSFGVRCNRSFATCRLREGNHANLNGHHHSSVMIHGCSRERSCNGPMHGIEKVGIVQDGRKNASALCCARLIFEVKKFRRV